MALPTTVFPDSTTTVAVNLAVSNPVAVSLVVVNPMAVSLDSTIQTVDSPVANNQAVDSPVANNQAVDSPAANSQAVDSPVVSNPETIHFPVVHLMVSPAPMTRSPRETASPVVPKVKDLAEDSPTRKIREVVRLAVMMTEPDFPATMDSMKTCQGSRTVINPTEKCLAALQVGTTTCPTWGTISMTIPQTTVTTPTACRRIPVMVISTMT